jgi:hypothetical protein
MDRSSKTGAEAIFRSLVAWLVWARRRRRPKHLILRMPRAGNHQGPRHRIVTPESLPRGAARIVNPRFLAREAGSHEDRGTGAAR